MITENITLDKLVSDIEQQIELLNAIAADNPILNEQLRILHESHEMLLYQAYETQRLEELVDPDDSREHTNIVDQQADDG